MVPWESLFAFSAAAFVLIIIPGPSVLFTIGRSLSYGRIGGLLSVWGNTLGTGVLMTAVALGVGAVIAQSVVIFTIIKIVGALYLIFLGVQAIRHRKRSAAVATEEAEPRSNWRQLGEGFVVGITNPKTIAFFIAVLPQFVVPSAGPVMLQMFELGIIFLILAVIFDSTWAIAASFARGWFGRSPKRIEGLTATGGVMMIGLGGLLAFTGNKS